MKKKWFLSLLTAFFVLSFLSSLDAQTSTTSSRSTRSGSRTGSSSTFREERKDEQRRGAVRDFVMAVIGGMLRHPDPTVRKQAVQAISTGMAGGDERGGGGSSSERGGIRSLFAVDDQSGGGGQDETSTGVGGAVFIPDLYVLLSDPDPEVRDIASVGLDMIFQTDSTMLRFMNDPEPLIRKYAAQIYAKKSFSQGETQRGDNREEMGQVKDLLALRTMLVRLKYEKEPDVRKAIVDSLEWYIRYGGDTREGGRGGSEQFGGDMFGVDAALTLEYLNDSNPELRKQAIKTIALRETSDNVLIKLMERLRIEQDEEVKKELMSALDTIRTMQYYKGDERGGAAGAGGGALPGGGTLPGILPRR